MAARTLALQPKRHVGAQADKCGIAEVAGAWIDELHVCSYAKPRRHGKVVVGFDVPLVVQVEQWLQALLQGVRCDIAEVPNPKRSFSRPGIGLFVQQVSQKLTRRLQILLSVLDLRRATGFTETVNDPAAAGFKCTAYFQAPRILAPRSILLIGLPPLPPDARMSDHDVCWNVPMIEAGIKRVRDA